MKLKDGTEIEFIPKPEWREDWWCAVKFIRPDGSQFGITFDEESYLEFMNHLTLLPFIGHIK